MARILCVDTDEQCGKYVCGHLTRAGHVCLYERCGERALRQIRENRIDLIICEVMLPDVCGFEVCRRIRADADFFAMPVMLMSSMAEPDEMRHGLAQGADDYLSKPFDAPLLLGRVAELVRLTGNAVQLDPITGLSSAKVIKASVQSAVSRRASFAVAYIEITSLLAFSKAHGSEARDKALRHQARIIERYGERSGSSFFNAGHIGAGHFVCVLEDHAVEAFCAGIRKSWNRHLPDFYASLGLSSETENGLLNLLICATSSAGAKARSAQEYLDLLAQLRKKALVTGNGGIHFDNRRNA